MNNTHCFPQNLEHANLCNGALALTGIVLRNHFIIKMISGIIVGEWVCCGKLAIWFFCFGAIELIGLGGYVREHVNSGWLAPKTMNDLFNWLTQSCLFLGFLFLRGIVSELKRHCNRTLQWPWMNCLDDYDQMISVRKH